MWPYGRNGQKEFLNPEASRILPPGRVATRGQLSPTLLTPSVITRPVPQPFSTHCWLGISLLQRLQNTNAKRTQPHGARGHQMSHGKEKHKHTILLIMQLHNFLLDSKTMVWSYSDAALTRPRVSSAVCSIQRPRLFLQMRTMLPLAAAGRNCFQ